MKHWIHGEHILGPKSKWAKFVRHPHNFPPMQGSATGGGGGGGVSAPPPSGGGGGGGGGMAPSSSAPPSNFQQPNYAPPPQSYQPPPGGNQFNNQGYAPPQPQYNNQEPMEPASFGHPDPTMPVSQALRAALDGTGPGYQQQPPGQMQQPGQQQPGQQFLPGQGTIQQQQPAQDPTWGTVRQVLNQFGVPIPETVTPQQGFAQIAQALRGTQERNYYTDLGRAATEDWDQYQAWRQQNQPQQQQPEGNELWNPPHYDPSWMNVVEEDPQTGRIRSKPGYNPAYGTQVQAYMDYLGTQQKEMWRNPQEFMWKFVQPLVQQTIQEGIQSSFGQYQTEVQAKSIINANAQWLYQADPATGRSMMQGGRPVLTPNGAIYFRYIDEAFNRLGITDVQAQNQYAVGMLERDLLRQRQMQPPQYQGQPQYQQQLPGPGQRQNAPMLQQQAMYGGYQQPALPNPYSQQPPQQQIPPGAGHFPNVNGLQQMTPAYRQDVQPTNEPPMGGSLADMMRQQFHQEGITDQHIRQDMNRMSMGGF